ncbi:MAG: hypothetical protein LM550_06775 [Candidatus Contendobacter sp.]|jgi:hypothetical protein|nr:hypothetical protein [Gammaproteobacteria bacterium]MCC8993382.1 hypothetical protein [Candidatus Contendobacter sp.]
MTHEGDDLFEALLRELFQGNGEGLRARLQPLAASERQALFREFRDLLKALQRACRYQPEAPLLKLPQLYQAIHDNPAAFLRDQSAPLDRPGALHTLEVLQRPAYKALQQFYSRLQGLSAGLAGKSAALGAFQHRMSYPIRTERFFLGTGRILLDRPEPWVQEVLVRVFAEFPRRTRFSGGEVGVAQLMQEALQRHPEWVEALAPSMGRAMRRDGFFDRSLARYDPAMILAGLEHEPSVQDAGFEPLRDSEVVKALLQRVTDGSLPRPDLITLILRKLARPPRSGGAKPWLDLFEALTLTDVELQIHASALIALINASTPAVGKRAMALIETHWLHETDHAADRIAALGIALHSPQRSLAGMALRLLKQQVLALPELTGPVLRVAVAGLGSPCPRLRSDLWCWLGAFPLHSFDEETLQQMREQTIALSAAGIISIAPLLAEPPASMPAPPAPATAAMLDAHANLSARIAHLRQWAEQDPDDVLLSRRLAFLDHWLVAGECGVLDATSPDHSAALTPPDFVEHETAEALALDLAQTQRRRFAWADYDRLFAGLLRFADAADADPVRPLLAPLVARLAFWQKPLTAGVPPGWAQAGELPALLLAQAWRERSIPTFPKGSRGEQMLNLHFGLPLQRRLNHVLNLLNAGSTTLLSLPTHAAGWLTPVVFAERFARLPGALLEPEELGAALYRLPALPEPRSAAWALLAPRIKVGIKDGCGAALTLALGPDALARAALARFLVQFERESPTEPLFYTAADFTSSSRPEAPQMRIIQADHAAPANVAFRLFNAALRCRFGLGDAGIAGQAPGLLSHLASSQRRWIESPQDSKPEATNLASSAVVFTELLFAPEPVTEALVARLHACRSSYLGRDTAFPWLWPYLMAHPSHVGIPEQVVDLAYRFPALAQRLFEAGLCRRLFKGDYYHDFAQALLAQGTDPLIEAQPVLILAAQSLISAHPAQREWGIGLLRQWLRDGRVTPQALAQTLAGLIRNVELGFASLEQTLDVLGEGGDPGQIIVLFALEQAIGSGVAGLSPRKLPLILDRLTRLLDETGRNVSEPTARRELERLAATAKKAGVRDQANALITRPVVGAQLPLAVLAVAALAAEW